MKPWLETSAEEFMLLLSFRDEVKNFRKWSCKNSRQAIVEYNTNKTEDVRDKTVSGV